MVAPETIAMDNWRIKYEAHIRSATNDQLEIDLALAIAELRRHGGTEAEVEALRAQFKIIADDQAETESKIPD
jgi:hypothetical protein